MWARRQIWLMIELQICLALLLTTTAKKNGLWAPCICEIQPMLALALNMTHKLVSPYTPPTHDASRICEAHLLHSQPSRLGSQAHTPAICLDPWPAPNARPTQRIAAKDTALCLARPRDWTRSSGCTPLCPTGGIGIAVKQEKKIPQ
ncbi:hypothetical protein C8R43DRAFT_26473 [Mycena crocata]|nr:hypothetical protein C8R43DRAFT_26473 [Mycena crocata]